MSEVERSPTWLLNGIEVRVVGPPARAKPPVVVLALSSQKIPAGVFVKMCGSVPRSLRHLGLWYRVRRAEPGDFGIIGVSKTSASKRGRVLEIERSGIRMGGVDFVLGGYLAPR